jgi:glutathione synthase/RimK-type ligase-like ATP-grasp enzyme
MDFCVDHGLVPALSRFIENAMHWRVVVVGGRAVASYPNPVKEDDFRSKPSADPADYRSEVEPSLAGLACAATAALGITFSGVDVLRAPGRADCVLEVNFPCYFPKAQLMAGIDVAGAMVDDLAATSHALGPAAAQVAAIETTPRPDHAG